MDDYERVLLVKPDVHVYRLPPRVSNRAYRASDWNLDAPDWNCRLRFISKGNQCCIKLDEKSTGQFFGQCPIEKYPGPAIETVSDSSRYFVLRLVNDETGRTAYVGVGFVDRSDSFDLNVALQDHFKILQMEQESSNKPEESLPKLDLGFKDGQTIKVNLNISKKSGSTSKPRPKGNASGILLPPPPGSNKPSLFNTQPTTDSNSSSEGSVNSKSEAQQSTFNQQLLDGLTSLTVSDNNTKSSTLFNEEHKSTKLQTFTPANSICVDEFATFPTSNTPAGDNKKKSDEIDLWSDFESFKPVVSENNTTSTNTGSSQFDNWAKF